MLCQTLINPILTPAIDLRKAAGKEVVLQVEFIQSVFCLLNNSLLLVAGASTDAGLRRQY